MPKRKKKACPAPKGKAAYFCKYFGMEFTCRQDRTRSKRETVSYRGLRCYPLFFETLPLRTLLSILSLASLYGYGLRVSNIENGVDMTPLFPFEIFSKKKLKQTKMMCLRHS